MIVRTWTGWTTDELADGYEQYMQKVALTGYSAIPGNQGVLMLRRPAGQNRTEFQMVTLWESMEAVTAFAGEHPERAVFYPEDDHFLVDRQWEVCHYEVYGRTGTLGETQSPGE